MHIKLTACSVSTPCVGSLIALLLVSLGACTNTTIDEYRKQEFEFSSDKSIVIIGRRHASDYETEPWIISCIGKQIAAGNSGIDVITEQDFMNELYPWFEPRTAPMQPQRLKRLLQDKVIADKVVGLGVQYIVWVDGSTQRTDSAGSISCAIGPGGAGCLGFGTWDDDSSYTVSIWDIEEPSSVAEISANAEGTSFMPAIIVPVPLIARVKTSVCNGVADQIKAMFPSPPAG
ncbi:MAG: hypothetical protein ACR2PS_06545 [Pseudomonadales bacterium]